MMTRVLLALMLMGSGPACLWAADTDAARPAPRPDPAASRGGLTLQECYALALERSEELAIQAEIIKATEGRFLQALAQALPSVSFESTEKWQDDSGGLPERKLTFSQPLFSGFKEFAAIAGSRDERRQRLAERERAELLLVVDVVEAFYLLRQQREDLKALEAVHRTLQERLQELRQRETLGRTRPSEVVSAEAQLRRVEAEQELVLGRIATARHLLEFLTGLPGVDALADAPEPLPALGPVSAYLAKAGDRPDVRAAESAWKVSQHEVAIAKSELWPSVDLESNYYAKRSTSTNVDWDVLLTVEVPIFQGGEAVGKVKEEFAQTRQVRLRFEATAREAVREIADLYSQAAAAQERYRSLKRANEASEESVRLQMEDYRVNLVNNLDVLQELQALQDARRDLIGATYDMKRLYWRLQTAVGETLNIR